MTTTADVPGVAAERLRVFGNTYPIRKRLRQLGCMRNARLRCWIAPDAETAAFARTLVRKSPLQRFLDEHGDAS